MLLHQIIMVNCTLWCHLLSMPSYMLPSSSWAILVRVSPFVTPFLFMISSSPPSPSSLCTSRDANQPDCMPLYLSLPFSLSISAVHLGTKSSNQTNQSAVQHSARVPAAPYRRPRCYAGITLIALQPLPALLSGFAIVSSPTPGITITKQPKTLDGEGVGRCRL